MKKIFFFSLVVLMTSGLLTTTAAAKEYGGVLKMISTSGISNLGIPGGSSLAGDVQITMPCIENLVGLDEDGGGTPVPRLATGWEVSSDYLHYTFSLRKGVKFHDGTDFNAEAAKYNLEQIMQSPLAVLSSVKSVDVVDDYTIRVNLKNTEPTFLSNITTGGCTMSSPTWLKAKGEEARFHPVGTGPYKFLGYQRDVVLKYERFDDYWGGKPYLDEMHFIFIDDPVTMLAAFKAGDGQVIRGVQPIDANAMSKAGKIGLTVTFAGMQGISGDSANPDSPFSDIKVRQAVAYAIDTEQICKTIGFGYLPAINQITVKGGYAYNPNIVGYPYNPEKAKKLLAEAGYADGFKTSILYRTSARQTDVFTAVAGYLADVGVTVKLEGTDRGNFMNARQKGWFNKMINQTLPGSAGYDPGLAMKNYLSKDAVNYVCVGIPDYYQATLYQANSENDPEKRRAMIKDLNKMIIDKYCLLYPLFGDGSITAYSEEVQDLDLGKFSGHDWHPENVWLKK